MGNKRDMQKYIFEKIEKGELPENYQFNTSFIKQKTSLMQIAEELNNQEDDSKK